MSQLSTNPSQVTISTLQKIPLIFDLTDQLQAGETVANASSTLTDTGTGSTVTLLDSPTVNNKTITQIIRGSSLTAGHTYRLLTVYTASSNKVEANDVTIVCPF